jgi:Bromodomain
MTAPAKDGFSEILKVVCSMLSRNECAVFREPVDWKGLELLDYPEIVQRPMDLGTIKKKIENDDYACVEDVATDIRLVWSNCMLYNRDGSEVRSQIISLSSDVCRRFFYL